MAGLGMAYAINKKVYYRRLWRNDEKTQNGRAFY